MIDKPDYDKHGNLLIRCEQCFDGKFANREAYDSYDETPVIIHGKMPNDGRIEETFWCMFLDDTPAQEKWFVFCSQECRDAFARDNGFGDTENNLSPFGTL